MANKIQVRRGTAAEWASANPTLAAGEPGFDTTNKVFKVGDGATAWASLPEVVDLTDVTGDVADHESRIDALESAGGGAVTDWDGEWSMSPVNSSPFYLMSGGYPITTGCENDGPGGGRYAAMTTYNSTSVKYFLIGGSSYQRFARKYGFEVVDISSYQNTWTNARVFVGAIAATAGTTCCNSDTDTSARIGFERFYTSGGLQHTNWQFVVSDGTTVSRVDTGMPFTIDTDTTKFKILVSPDTPDTVTWEITSPDDSASGSVTSGFPTDTTPLGFGHIFKAVDTSVYGYLRKYRSRIRYNPGYTV